MPNMIETLATELEAAIHKIERLTKQNAVLESRLAALENKNVIPAPIEPQTTVTTIDPRFPEGFEKPTDAEFEQLERAVISRFPRLIEREYEPDKFSKHFRWAFLSIALMRRQDTPKGKYFSNAYLDEAQSRARWAGARGEFEWYPFIAAVIAHGDVPWNFVPDDRYFRVTDIGLRIDDFGRTAKNHWRGPLNGSFPLAPGRDWNLAA